MWKNFVILHKFRQNKAKALNKQEKGKNMGEDVPAVVPQPEVTGGAPPLEGLPPEQPVATELPGTTISPAEGAPPLEAAGPQHYKTEDDVSPGASTDSDILAERASAQFPEPGESREESVPSAESTAHAGDPLRSGAADLEHKAYEADDPLGLLESSAAETEAGHVEKAAGREFDEGKARRLVSEFLDKRMRAENRVLLLELRHTTGELKDMRERLSEIILRNEDKIRTIETALGKKTSSGVTFEPEETPAQL